VLVCVCVCSCVLACAYVVCVRACACACACVRACVACVFAVTYFERSASGLAKYAVGLRLILTLSRSPWVKYTLPLLIES